MSKIVLLATATVLLATPALAQQRGLFGEKRGPAPYDYSTETGQSRMAPSYQARSAGRLQTGDAMESGGVARERLITGSVKKSRKANRR